MANSPLFDDKDTSDGIESFYARVESGRHQVALLRIAIQDPQGRKAQQRTKVGNSAAAPYVNSLKAFKGTKRLQRGNGRAAGNVESSEIV
jgi:hypothetical protein